MFLDLNGSCSVHVKTCSCEESHYILDHCCVFGQDTEPLITPNRVNSMFAGASMFTSHGSNNPLASEQGELWTIFGYHNGARKVLHKCSPFILGSFFFVFFNPFLPPSEKITGRLSNMLQEQ